MKKIIVFLLVFILMFTLAIPVFAVKPASLPEQASENAVENFQEMLTKQEEKQLADVYNNGIEKYKFYLSADLMPVPPYGTGDIEGSDIKSKLLVNQPNGANLAVVTGIMKGLLPETEYTVYISNGYKDVVSVWNVLGEYTYTFLHNGIEYPHTLTLETQEGGIITGSGSNTDGTVLETITGTIIGNTMTLTVSYVGSTYEYSMELTIAEDGSFSGFTLPGAPHEATITSVTGNAVLEEVEVTATTWTGLLTEDIQPFTFITDEEGNGSWHINITDSQVVLEEGMIDFSVWINDGGTILISEVVMLVE